MKAIRSCLLVLVIAFGQFAVSSDQFPTGPNPTTTPGDVCVDSGVKRYPEQIDYCERNVSSDLKKELIKSYDEKFGYQIEQMNRQDFKIDHFIPLSIGGSNSEKNLWPQHKSVYTVTDPLELVLSQKISAGRIKQAEAIRVIKEGKLNLGRVPDLMQYVNSL